MKLLFCLFVCIIFSKNSSAFTSCKSLRLLNPDICAKECKKRSAEMTYHNGQFGCMKTSSKKLASRDRDDYDGILKQYEPSKGPPRDIRPRKKFSPQLEKKLQDEIQAQNKINKNSNGFARYYEQVMTVENNGRRYESKLRPKYQKIQDDLDNLRESCKNRMMLKTCQSFFNEYINHKENKFFHENDIQKVKNLVSWKISNKCTDDELKEWCDFGSKIISGNSWLAKILTTGSNKVSLSDFSLPEPIVTKKDFINNLPEKEQSHFIKMLEYKTGEMCPPPKLISFDPKKKEPFNFEKKSIKSYLICLCKGKVKAKRDESINILKKHPHWKKLSNEDFSPPKPGIMQMMPVSFRSRNGKVQFNFSYQKKLYGLETDNQACNKGQY